MVGAAFPGTLQNLLTLETPTQVRTKEDSSRESARTDRPIKLSSEEGSWPTRKQGHIYAGSLMAGNSSVSLRKTEKLVPLSSSAQISTQSVLVRKETDSRHVLSDFIN